MSKRATSLFFVVVVHHKARMDNPWNPAEQGQKDAEKKTGDAAGHQHGQWRKHYTEKVSQRFHFCFFLICDVLRAPLVFTNS